MIEINLLPGKKKKAAAGGAGFKLALPDFRGLLASIKNPWLLVASATSLIVVGGGCSGSSPRARGCGCFRTAASKCRRRSGGLTP